MEIKKYARLAKKMKLCGLCGDYGNKEICEGCKPSEAVCAEEAEEFWLQTKMFKDRLAQYVRAQSEDRLLRLPCGIGNVVYYLEGYSAPEIRLFEVREIKVKSSGVTLCDARGAEHSAEDCYLTREEALRAAKALEEVNELLMTRSMSICDRRKNGED